MPRWIRAVFGSLAAVAAVACTVDAGAAEAGPGACVPGDPLRPRAELFATDNTAVITDPGDGRLRNRLEWFELQVDAIAVQGLVLPVGSVLVNGVFWSGAGGRATYERSREFRFACVDASGLHHVAEAVRSRFRQESVLTFEELPKSDHAADAVMVEVLGTDWARLGRAVLADPRARSRLGGGSVTDGGAAILVAAVDDLLLVWHVLSEAGADLRSATLHYGRREFV